MDLGRAKQIIESPEEIEVLYQGVPIWINRVNDDDTARVHTRGNPNDEKVVAVNDLEETH